MFVLAHLSKERACWLGLAAALVLAPGLRLHALGDEDYWIDELYALLNSAGTKDEFRALPHGEVLAEVPRLTEIPPGTTVFDVWRSMEGDNHPPLYFVLSHLWRRGLGDGEFAVRLLPVLLSVLSIVPVFLMLRAYGRPGPAVWASLLLAMAYGHIYVGQQNRQYALALLLVGCSFWFWARLECGWPNFDRRRKLLWGILYGASMAAAVLTHYFAALPLISQAPYAMARARGRLRRFWL
ncbi:MAG: phospholipid carrier-dependent glycosyltransferase, partial [bacterium]|nr:phospholipid carrier-dependent glycosyltransferase [bacterium]